MCIHDMRSPTNSIQHGLEQTLVKIKEYQKELKTLTKRVRIWIIQPDLADNEEFKEIMIDIYGAECLQVIIQGGIQENQS